MEATHHLKLVIRNFYSALNDLNHPFTTPEKQGGNLSILSSKTSNYYLLLSMIIVCSQMLCAVLSHCFTAGLHVCTGKCILCLKAHGSCNQVQNNHTNYEFNYDLIYHLSESCELLRWKLKKHDG